LWIKASTPQHNLIVFAEKGIYLVEVEGESFRETIYNIEFNKRINGGFNLQTSLVCCNGPWVKN
jgi:hypothetical protein